MIDTDRISAALGATADQGAVNNEVLHEILAELKKANPPKRPWWNPSFNLINAFFAVGAVVAGAEGLLVYLNAETIMHQMYGMGAALLSALIIVTANKD